MVGWLTYGHPCAALDERLSPESESLPNEELGSCSSSQKTSGMRRGARFRSGISCGTHPSRGGISFGSREGRLPAPSRQNRDARFRSTA